MEIRGVIETIVFRNETNCYTVVELDVKGLPVVATGTFPICAEGDNVVLTGEFKDTKYGNQFQVSKIKMASPESIEGITRYLASGLFRGIGEKTSVLLVEKFGTEVLKIIETNPLRLTEVKGISAKKATEIANSYVEVKQMKEVIMFLQERGVSVNLAIKIYKTYGKNTVEKIKKNPYRLVEDIDGIGFLTADKIAEKMGVKKDSEYRIRAGLIYTLKRISQYYGSTCVPKEKLFEETKESLRSENVDDKMMKVLRDMIEDSAIKEITKDDGIYYCLSIFYYMEKSIAEKLLTLDGLKKDIHLDIDDVISEYEHDKNIVLHEMQKEAIKNAINSGVSVITGGPGTGKTTIVRCIIFALKKDDKSFALLAPTGRAAKRLAETTKEDAKTIHRFLDLDFKDGKGTFLYNENNKLKEDVIIVDEVSMTDVFVMNSLIKAIKNGAKLIMVGDSDQLPSVGAGNVLADIIESKRFSVSKLTEIYRQGNDSLIISNAHRINNGEMPILKKTDSDFFHSNISEPMQIKKRIIEMVKDTLPEYLNISADEIQVLSPVKKTPCGVNELNVALQEELNPRMGYKNEIAFESGLLREGDKVMHINNNYNIPWVKGPTKEEGQGVFNGDMGKIIRVEKSPILVTVEMEDGRIVDYDQSAIAELQLAYAISVHKSQGCEFEVVIIPITGGHPGLYTRNLLYTGVTRAKKAVVLIGDVKNIYRMVKNNYIEKRFTTLKDFLNNTI